MSGSKGIPTPDEFERASRLMENKSRGLDQVRNDVLSQFRTRGELYEFFILDQRDVDFRAYIFFPLERDIAAAYKSGLTARIVDFVYDALERQGRGRRGDIEVAFEFDCHENVQRSFEGDYSLRLRG